MVFVARAPRRLSYCLSTRSGSIADLGHRALEGSAAGPRRTHIPTIPFLNSPQPHANLRSGVAVATPGTTHRQVDRQEYLIVPADFPLNNSIQKPGSSGGGAFDWSKTCYYTNEERSYATKQTGLHSFSPTGQGVKLRHDPGVVMNSTGERLWETFTDFR